ncbi:hypothetical protein BT63DRAFT_99613 [Microthyrium microscopicum]|uniref:Cell wall protein PhiA n=1 Tax=Microthyrium microscopicum TaxID=703497 RepID=A0A6A6TW59_9PEZI|nr:hypothetical protein BT63DRAFT_99613 [Microthyrium microscopicum]
MVHFLAATLAILAILQLGLVAAADGPGLKRTKGYYWVRAVTAPNFHKYLQSSPLYSPGPAILGNRTAAGQFNIDSSGQLYQLVVRTDSKDSKEKIPQDIPKDNRHLFLTVSSEKTHGGKTLATSLSETPNKFGKFAFQGDTLTWSGPEKRPQENAWLVCAGQRLFINLSGFKSPTSECAEQTIHYFNGEHVD